MSSPDDIKKIIDINDILANTNISTFYNNVPYITLNDIKQLELDISSISNNITNILDDITNINYNITDIRDNITDIRDDIKLLDDNLNVHATTIASEDILGHVKIDNNTITIDENGILTAHTKINAGEIPDLTIKWEDISDKPIISNISNITTYNKDSHLLTINAISELIDSAVKNVPGLSDEEREKLNNIEECAQVNKIEAIVYDGRPLEIVDKTVTLPDLSSTPETTVVNNFEIGTIFAHISNNTPYGALALNRTNY